MRYFTIDFLKDYRRRFNVAPGQRVPIIKTFGELSDAQWGLIPSWAKDPSIGNKMINARAETVAEKPSFRAAFKKRRCLVIADGFYEWRSVGTKKQPVYIFMKGHQPFAFAGLWESWKPAEGDAIDSVTIITTESNSLLKDIHQRMPVIIDRKDWDKWLSIESPPAEVQQLLRPFSENEMDYYAVSSVVNNPKNDTMECTQAIERLN